MADFHIILQSKGGVGKSLLSYYLMQYLNWNAIDESRKCKGFDTDYSTPTLSKYKNLDVELLKITEDLSVNNTRDLDKMFLNIENSEKNIVVDVGANSFIHMLKYLQDIDAPNTLEEYGYRLCIHTIICYGKDFNFCCNAYDGIMSVLSKNDTENLYSFIWCNYYLGKSTVNDITFEETKIYNDWKNYISSIGDIPSFFSTDTTFNSLNRLIENGITIDEAIESNTTSIPEKIRYKSMKKAITSMFELAFL